MKYFPFNPEVDFKIKELLNLINLRKNGETASVMNSNGITYKKNFGVSISHLESIAASHVVSFDVCERLWYMEIRETMILATLLVSQNNLNFETTCNWSQLVVNEDIARHSAKNLFSQLNYSTKLATYLLTTHSHYQKVLAVYILAGAIKRQSIMLIDVISAVDSQILNSNYWNSHIPVTPISFIMQQIIRYSSEGKAFANRHESLLRNFADPRWHLIAENIHTESLYS